LNADEHHDLQLLLPWFVTDRLAPDEQARVAAHVAGCPECQAEVRFQTRLEAEVARLPIDVEEGWAAMKARVEADRSPVRRTAAAVPRAAWAGWGVAAALAVVAGVSVLPGTRLAGGSEPGYRTLSAASAPAPVGNVIVIFRPDATEAAMREALRTTEARLVDGPTASDAYLLAVAPAKRNAAIALLRTRHEVVLAEAVDSTP